MPLSGTIQDFGVADIFQLIGHQAKTGRLALTSGPQTVLVLFRDGAVVHAENVSNPVEALFGNLLVRAEVISPGALEQALAEQRRTLKRIGSVLVDLGHVDPSTVLEFARLQMTETLYSLFGWTHGTYEFEATEVEPSPDGVAPIRAEHVVMNGIRMSDEWPALREQIPSPKWRVERMRSLPAAGLEEPERTIHGLVGPGRPVRALVDLSRLGEFETYRAIGSLIDGGFVRVIKPSPAAPAGRRSGERIRRASLDLGRVLLSAACVGVGGLGVVWGLAERRAPSELRLEDRALSQRLEAMHRRRLERVLEVYRLRHGAYPPSLDSLVEEGLLHRPDLSFPYREPYAYRLEPGGYALEAPLR